MSRDTSGRITVLFVRAITQLVTDWMVRGSNPGGSEIFRTRLDHTWGPPSLLYKRYRVSPRGKCPRRGVDHPPQLAPRLKKEKSYNSIPRLGPRGLFMCP